MWLVSHHWTYLYASENVMYLKEILAIHVILPWHWHPHRSDCVCALASISAWCTIPFITSTWSLGDNFWPVCDSWKLGLETHRAEQSDSRYVRSFFIFSLWSDELRVCHCAASIVCPSASVTTWLNHLRKVTSSFRQHYPGDQKTPTKATKTKNHKATKASKLCHYLWFGQHSTQFRQTCF